VYVFLVIKVVDIVGYIMILNMYPEWADEDEDKRNPTPKWKG
jgi:hypothetical protein